MEELACDLINDKEETCSHLKALHKSYQKYYFDLPSTGLLSPVYYWLGWNSYQGRVWYCACNSKALRAPDSKGGWLVVLCLLFFFNL